MDRRHKKKAVIGVIAWLAVIPVMLVVIAIGESLSPNLSDHGWVGGMVALFLVVQYGLYFWAGSHLAKAKGHSSAILLWGILCWLTQFVVMAVLLFALPDRCPDPSQPRRKKNHGRDESHVSRVVRYRRNALVANVLGATGILLSAFFIFFQTELFEDHRNDQLVGLVLFLAGYVTTLYGCWWWVKAKNWPDAVIFIGFMPLVPLFIPYVRILYVRLALIPLILLMLLMPIVLIGVVAALPDRSGISKRKHRDRLRGGSARAGDP